MPTTLTWMTTGRRTTAHILENDTFALCGVMPPQWNALWSPVEQRRFHESGTGEWHNASGGERFCVRCGRLNKTKEKP